MLLVLKRLPCANAPSPLYHPHLAHPQTLFLSSTLEMCKPHIYLVNTVWVLYSLPVKIHLLGKNLNLPEGVV